MFIDWDVRYRPGYAAYGEGQLVDTCKCSLETSFSLKRGEILSYKSRLV